MSPAGQDYVGRYRLLNLLRTGKTCQVWEVIDDGTSRRLAMKLLLAEFRNRTEIGYLKHEFAVGRDLDHPRVIRLFEFGMDKDQVFLAMELFPAPNIKQVINLGVERIAHLAEKIMLQAAQGLAYFHTRGWVHRDIKPDNYLVDSSGEVKLIDFALATKKRGGLSRLFGGRSKAIMGTRSYMSPEQIRGQHLDQRADIYSFGCMCFELVSGKLPFTGVSTQELLTKHLRNPAPPLQSANPNVTEPFAQLVKRMLAKKPEDRPDSLEDFVSELGSMRVFKRLPKVSAG